MMKTPYKTPNTKAVETGWPKEATTDSPKDPKTPPRAATLELRKVVREVIPIHAAIDGEATLGKILDDHLADAAIEGHEVQSFKLEIDPEYWKALAIYARRREAEARGG